MDMNGKIPLVGNEEFAGIDVPRFIVGIPLIDKENIRKKKKAKREKFVYLKDKVQKILIPQINAGLDDHTNLRGDINWRARDVARELNLEEKTDVALYAGLRFLLFFEGIDLHIKNNGEENFFTINRISGFGGDGLPPSILKTFDNMDLDGWYIKRNRDHMSAKHSLIEKDNYTFTLESEGDIYFDRRDLTEQQALDFVKYMSGKDLQAPEFVYLTPINIVLSDEYLRDMGRFRSMFNDIDVNKVGTEFRIVKSGDEFLVTSIYGKECTVHEFEIDSLIKGCSLRSVAEGFSKEIQAEMVPERIEILKKIIPEMKTKYPAMIKGKRLIITNSTGTFHISLIDGTLHKIYNEKGGYKYICVGSIYNAKSGSIIHNGNRYDIDRTTDTILAKMKMLLDEKYPDETTKRQIFS